MEIDELLRMGNGKKLQQHRIHHAEDGGVRPDPQGERQDRYQGEDRRLLQLPQGKAKVLRKSQHRGTPARTSLCAAVGAIRVPNAGHGKLLDLHAVSSKLESDEAGIVFRFKRAASGNGQTSISLDLLEDPADNTNSTSQRVAQAARCRGSGFAGASSGVI